MLIRDISKIKSITSADGCSLKEILRPKIKPGLGYSLAHAVVKPGRTTILHKLKSSEVYFILEGKGVMHIGGESAKVQEGQAVYIPPNSIQKIKNTGKKNLVFICIVEPAWKPECEAIVKETGEKK